MCGRLVNLDTVARVLADYYHLKTDKQLAALDEALSRVPAETVVGGHEKDHFADPGNMVGDTISRAAAIDVIEAGRLTKLIDAETAVNGLKALPSATSSVPHGRRRATKMAEFKRICEEWKRIHETVPTCMACPISLLNNKTGKPCYELVRDSPATAEKIILDWAEKNPAKTNAKKFAEVFGFPYDGRFLANDAVRKWLGEEYR